MKLVKGFINRIRTSDYTKSLLVLTGGTFIAQLIPIIFYPIIGRLVDILIQFLFLKVRKRPLILVY